MIALDYIAQIKPVTDTTSVKECMEIMFDNLCFELPVVKDGKLFGTVQLDECIHTEEITIESIVDSGFASVHFNTHLFDVLRIFNESKANVCCVLGKDFEWIGILTKTLVVEAIAHSLTVEQGGAIIVIEMATLQYSSSEVARIVESEGSQLLGLWLHNVPDSGRIRASLKLNTKNAERIIGGLTRFNYEVIATFGDDDYKENVEKRFQSLMKYLDI
ncbi:MAG: CBS domain-containing protein [Bacteroidia bacterium]|nr:CBS domain-containing protein [Bacteroidia bacterium]NNJ55305.1 CBS domain-containing protein [Bacteroidia bacterium]